VITGIVVALPEELTTLTSKKLAKGCVETLADKTLVICSGAGADNARAASELLIKHGANRLISWGCAAALDSALEPGNLILANQCVDVGQAVVAFDTDWLKHVHSILPKSASVRIGSLVDSKYIVAACADKAQIAKSTGAIALDMETVTIAKIAQAYGLDFLCVRAIADPLSMDLPKAVSHALNDQGEVVLGKLLLFLLLHPAELPGLIRLGLHFHAAKKTLKLVAKQLEDITAFPQAIHTTQLNNNNV
jgi:adenosylhomocysteine nucleosidase